MIRVNTVIGDTYISPYVIKIIEPDGNGGSIIQLVQESWTWSLSSTNTPVEVYEQLDAFRMKNK